MENNVKNFFLFLKNYNKDIPFMVMIQSFPEDIKDDEHYYHNNHIILGEMKNVTKLPNNLTLSGGLNVDFTNISELPNNLTVHGYLSMVDTDIKSFPKNIKIIPNYLSTSSVKGIVHIRNSPIAENYTDEEIHSILGNEIYIDR
jgi:hypothetical protein